MKSRIGTIGLQLSFVPWLGLLMSLAPGGG